MCVYACVCVFRVVTSHHSECLETVLYVKYYFLKIHFVESDQPNTDMFPLEQKQEKSKTSPTSVGALQSGTDATPTRT